MEAILNPDVPKLLAQKAVAASHRSRPVSLASRPNQRCASVHAGVCPAQYACSREVGVSQFAAMTSLANFDENNPRTWASAAHAHAISSGTGRVGTIPGWFVAWLWGARQTLEIPWKIG